METVKIKNILEDVKQSYQSWSEFMEQEVNFWKVEKDWHTKLHCARVLLLSLIMGRLNHLCIHRTGGTGNGSGVP